MEEIKQHLKGLQNITRCFTGFQKVNLKKTEGLNEFEKLIRALPSGEIIGKSLDEWKTQAAMSLQKLMSIRKAEFGRYVADFIRAQKELKTSIREFNNAWRIGPVEMQLRPEQADVQFNYNNEVLVKWFPVSSADNLSNRYAEVKKQLDDMALPIEKLTEVFWLAYEYLKWKRSLNNESNAHVVPALDFYREVRVSLFRSALESKQTPKVMPLWAFLYNLDRYCSASSQILQNKRIGLQSGSQHEVSNKKGIIVNGLDALQDYKTICHIIA